jgi:hypothetical protein
VVSQVNKRWKTIMVELEQIDASVERLIFDEEANNG